MNWRVRFHDEFEPEFDVLGEDVQDALLETAKALLLAGPKAGRPHVDTLAGSKHVNMKELRFTAHDGREVWRAAFAFDPERSAIVLVAASKQGQSEALFYKRLLRIADQRFDSHLRQMQAARIARR